MTGVQMARAASSRVTEARIELARLRRLAEEQEKVVNLGLAQIDSFLAITEAMAGDVGEGEKK